MKSKLLVGTTFALMLLGAISPSVKANASSVGCFRQTWDGLYRTIGYSDQGPIGWALIHEGPCVQCEGKSAAPPDACIEPGDPGYFSSPKGAENHGKSRRNVW